MSSRILSGFFDIKKCCPTLYKSLLLGKNKGVCIFSSGLLMSETFMFCHVYGKKDIKGYVTVPCTFITQCNKQTQRESESSILSTCMPIGYPAFISLQIKNSKGTTTIVLKRIKIEIPQCTKPEIRSISTSLNI
jgi:hypothetical protein